MVRPAPSLDAAGEYVANPNGRPIRIYTQIDTRLTFGDMVAKLALANRA